ncbi:MAG TPA: hypothetical protein VFN59_07845, partial [Acidimicrobiales bacterium]|nr:hypothetical protein [Acidimicrobiales bacterium]
MSKARRWIRPAVMIGGLVAGIAAGSVAWSYFTTNGGGPGAVVVDKLNPVNDVRATFPDSTQRTVDIRWAATADVGGPNFDGYYVQRVQGASSSYVCSSSPTHLLALTACADTLVPSGTYTYVVTAVFGSWTTTGVSGPVVVPASALTTYVVASDSPDPVAGTPDPLAITAFDQYGNVDTNLAGTQCLTFSGPVAAPGGQAPVYPSAGSCASGSAVTFADGVASASVTLYDAAPTTLSVSDSSGDSGQVALDVTPG